MAVVQSISRLRTALAPAWVLALALFLWLSITGFALRLSPDEAAYKLVEAGIFDGHWPYRDRFINRQPLTFLWYVPMGLGASVEAERVIAAGMMAASVPVMMRLGARWLSPERAAPVGVVYALLLANPLMPVYSNTEAFLLLPLTASFAVTSPLAAGTLFGVAVMTKLHAAVFAPVLFVLWRRQLLHVGAGSLAVVVLCSAPFLPVWREYWDGNVTFALSYGDYTSGDRIDSLGQVSWPLIFATLPLWVAALIGALRVRRGVVLLWALCGVIAVKASGHAYDHYYALLVPPVALLAVEGIAYMHSRRALRPLLVATSMFALLLSAIAVYAVFSSRGAGPYEELADALSDKPGEVFVLGSRSDVYVYADRAPGRRFFFSIPYVIEPAWAASVRADLLACPPDVLVVPEDLNFSVAWRDDVTSLYRTDETHEGGVIYTHPRIDC